MTRENKYRAFYKSKMFDVWRIEWITEINNVSMRRLYDDNSGSYNEYWFASCGEAINLMQFTGLKDKNDKEPCIKDIVVLHLLQGAIPSVIEIHDRWEVPVVKFFETWEPLYIYMGKDKDDTCVEIIGNIYENPELLSE